MDFVVEKGGGEEVRTLASFDVLSRVYTRRVRCASRVFSLSSQSRFFLTSSVDARV